MTSICTDDYFVLGAALKLNIKNMSAVDGVLAQFDVAVSTTLTGALAAYSANDNFASRFVVDISDCKARLTEEY